jgi:DNA-binding CsgD family transcriptional regulator
MDEWIEFFIASNMVQTSAIVRAVRSAHGPVTWDGVRANSFDSPDDMVMFSAAEAFGVCHGIALPVKMHGGDKGNVFLQLERESLADAERSALLTLASVAHARLRDFDEVPPERDELSGREREVLNWFSSGKSAEDTATIMGITASTVMFHYRQVAVRYGTLNRAHTIVEALRRGAMKLS